MTVRAEQATRRSCGTDHPSVDAHGAYRERVAPTGPGPVQRTGAFGACSLRVVFDELWLVRYRSTSCLTHFADQIAYGVNIAARAFFPATLRVSNWERERAFLLWT